ncbi:hypothetical protein ACFO0N_07960 [Halobium salinum]|uniref:Uncharacterized protein n=1 Tax=Halobium salinum TaxID=1364940 RepID=A0ABD5PB15_9EURY|nr:hypothetical protein [Halobium salinum]
MTGRRLGKREWLVAALAAVVLVGAGAGFVADPGGVGPTDGGMGGGPADSPDTTETPDAPDGDEDGSASGATGSDRNATTVDPSNDGASGGVGGGDGAGGADGGGDDGTDRTDRTGARDDGDGSDRTDGTDGVDESDRGTVSLSAGGGHTETPFVSVDDAVPGANGRSAATVVNDGSRDAVLSVAAADVRSLENGRTDPERDVDTTGGATEGELGDALELRVRLDRADGSTVYLVGSDHAFISLTDFVAGGVAGSAPVDAGEQVRFVAEWRLPTTVGNEVQTDSVELGFRLALRGR